MRPTISNPPMVWRARLDGNALLEAGSSRIGCPFALPFAQHRESAVFQTESRKISAVRKAPRHGRDV